MSDRWLIKLKFIGHFYYSDLWIYFFKIEKMEKGTEEIQTRIKKLQYDSTIFDFHYLYLDAGILNDLISLHCSLTLFKMKIIWIQILFLQILTSLFQYILLSFSRIGTISIILLLNYRGDALERCTLLNYISWSISGSSQNFKSNLSTSRKLTIECCIQMGWA